MDSNSSSSSAIEIIIYVAVFYVFYELLMWYLQRNSSSKSTCGCHQSSPPEHKVSSQDLSSKEKACVAVGICDYSHVGSFTKEEVHKWRHSIIQHADKIFGKNQKEKPKPQAKKAKRK